MQCYVENCKCEPVASFVWPWGEEGLVCSQHRILLQQKAEQLGQACVVTPLNAGAPPPIDLEERTQFHAQILALREDNDRLRTNGMKLFRELEERKQAERTLLAEKQALTGRIDQLLEEVERAQKDALAKTEIAASMADELQSLRALLPSPEPEV